MKYFFVGQMKIEMFQMYFDSSFFFVSSPVWSLNRKINYSHSRTEDIFYSLSVIIWHKQHLVTILDRYYLCIAKRKITFLILNPCKL